MQSISKEWGGLPRDLSAGFQWKNNKNYFFQGDTYWRFSERWLLFLDADDAEDAVHQLLIHPQGVHYRPSRTKEHSEVLVRMSKSIDSIYLLDRPPMYKILHWCGLSQKCSQYIFKIYFDWFLKCISSTEGVCTHTGLFDFDSLGASYFLFAIPSIPSIPSLIRWEPPSSSWWKIETVAQKVFLRSQ